MRLPFLDRADELTRLRGLFARREGMLAVLYGRRRCGKSRLLREALPRGRSISFVADEREPSLQRAALAVEVSRRLPGFADVAYPDWDALFTRFWREARRGTVLALDEFPSLVASAPEVPSLLQRRIDRGTASGIHLVLSGSSQRMMQGLVLDRSAPLFGRATEILQIAPLPAGWTARALGLRDQARAVEAFAVFGGVPRYWELAADFPSLAHAIRDLILSPLGVLHDEPGALLLDDLRETTQASSLLALIGAGCHRLSEIAGRMGKPATSLARPLSRLVELGLARRDLPFGESARTSKRSLYRIDDPFLRFWFRFVDPRRSELASRRPEDVTREVVAAMPPHVASVFEDLVRQSVPRARYFGRPWGKASAWWGPGLDRQPLEIGLIAEATPGGDLLVGEVKWGEAWDWPRELALLRQKAARLPLAAGRRVFLALWSRGRSRALGPAAAAFSPCEVMAALR